MLMLVKISDYNGKEAIIKSNDISVIEVIQDKSCFYKVFLYTPIDIYEVFRIYSEASNITKTPAILFVKEFLNKIHAVLLQNVSKVFEFKDNSNGDIFISTMYSYDDIGFVNLSHIRDFRIDEELLDETILSRVKLVEDSIPVKSNKCYTLSCFVEQDGCVVEHNLLSSYIKDKLISIMNALEKQSLTVRKYSNSSILDLKEWIREFVLEHDLADHP